MATLPPLPGLEPTPSRFSINPQQSTEPLVNVDFMANPVQASAQVPVSKIGTPPRIARTVFRKVNNAIESTNIPKLATGDFRGIARDIKQRIDTSNQEGRRWGELYSKVRGNTATDAEREEYDALTRKLNEENFNLVMGFFGGEGGAIDKQTGRILKKAGQKGIDLARGVGEDIIKAGQGNFFAPPAESALTTKLKNLQSGTKGAEKIAQQKVPLISKIAQEHPPVSAEAIVKNSTPLERETLQSQTQKITAQHPELPPESSLETIIKNDPLPVQKKIGLLDYLRTPDRVFEKIGMKSHMDLLRTQYEKYVAELPKNIQTITNWANQVPKESSQRIFQFLDGKAIQLNPAETKIAGEVKTWLQDWAQRLGLPNDKRISNYITHIFEPDFIAKEFDPDIAKLIRDKIPGSVYDPFLESRLGKKGYIEDAWAALDAYVKRATRKVNLDPALTEIKRDANTLENSQFNYIKSKLDSINLRPSSWDELLDNTIKQSPIGYKLGQRPVANITRKARQMVFRGALGLNPVSALRNLTQGANTYAKLGERYTILGYAKALTNWNSGELERVGVLADNFVQDRALSASKKFWEKTDKVLFSFFNTAEKINRGAAYFGAKAKGIAQGMTEEKAIEYAKKLVRDTQFSYASIDTPVALQSDLAKTIAQFQTYPLKQAEFLVEMAKNKEFAGLFRYGLAGMAMVYTVGKLFGMSPKDLIPIYRFDTPPTLKVPVEIGKAILGSKDQYGKVPSITQRFKNIGNAMIPYIPAGVQLKRTFQGLSAVAQGGSKTASGRFQYRVPKTPLNYIRAGLFGKYNFPQAQQYYNKSNKKKVGGVPELPGIELPALPGL